MTILADYQKFKEENKGKAFVDDQEFFKKKYGFELYPFARDVFIELSDLKTRLDKLERRF